MASKVKFISENTILDMIQIENLSGPSKLVLDSKKGKTQILCIYLNMGW